MPEIIEIVEPVITEKVPLLVPVVIPEKTITDVRVNFLTYTYQALDAADGQVKLVNVVINMETLAGMLALLAELEKDAKVRVLSLG